MNATPFDPSPSPYRHPSPAAASPPPSLAPALTLALSAITLVVSLSTSALVRAASPACLAHPPSRADATPSRFASSLDAAVNELARRHRRPLFVAPDVEARAARASVAPGSPDGPLAESVRALDAYAAARGLWFHDVDGVLRLEREVTSADLLCDDTLDACAARLERVAAISVVRAGPSILRPIHLRARRGVPAVECLRSALDAAGLRVDVVDRTLYVVSAGAPEDGAIRALGRGRFALTRDAVDHMLGRQGELMRGTRILPEVRGGRTVGVRVLGVHPGDLLAALGIESDDVLVRVNGSDVASPDHCLAAYASMGRTDRVVVELERRGRPVALTYVIDPA
jgi:hypothetical protein